MPRVFPSQVVSYIDARFPFAQQPKAETLHSSIYQGGLNALLRLVDELPEELITLSENDYNKFVDSVETLRSVAALWQIGQVDPYGSAPAARAVTQLRQSLVALPDQAIPAATHDLAFVTDVDLRESIRGDIASAEQALRDGEWKGATVIGGAIIEALLLWAITQKPPGDVLNAVSDLKAAGRLRAGISTDPNEWMLDAYIKVARHLDIIMDDTAKLVELTQGFRNLIHPGKAIRTQQACNRSTARVALAAVDRVVDTLTP
jgi:hypothetical protein